MGWLTYPLKLACPLHFDSPFRAHPHFGNAPGSPWTPRRCPSVHLKQFLWRRSELRRSETSVFTLSVPEPAVPLTSRRFIYPPRLLASCWVSTLSLVAVHAAAPPHSRLPSSRAGKTSTFRVRTPFKLRPRAQRALYSLNCGARCRFYWWCDRLPDVWQRVGRDAPRGGRGGWTTVLLVEEMRRYREQVRLCGPCTHPPPPSLAATET